MASVELSKVQSALAEWMDNRVMSALDTTSPARWMLGGVSSLALANLQNVIRTYAPLLKSLGVLDETGNLVLTVVEAFVNNAFQKQGIVKMPLLGIPFTFNADDGQALIECLKRHGGI